MAARKYTSAAYDMQSFNIAICADELLYKLIYGLNQYFTQAGGTQQEDDLLLDLTGNLDAKLEKSWKD